MSSAHRLRAVEFFCLTQRNLGNLWGKVCDKQATFVAIAALIAFAVYDVDIGEARLGVPSRSHEKHSGES